MSLLFNTQSRFVIAFLSRSKCPLISWLKSPSAVILEPKENKIYHCFYFFPYLLALKWWDQIPWSYIAGSYGNSMVNLWETAKLFCKVNVAFYILTSNVWEFCILHILSKTCYCLFFLFITAILVVMKWYLVVLICISLTANDIAHLFMYLLAICIFLEKCLFRCFAHFNWIIYAFYYWVLKVLYIVQTYD